RLPRRVLPDRAARRGADVPSRSVSDSRLRGGQPGRAAGGDGPRRTAVHPDHLAAGDLATRARLQLRPDAALGGHLHAAADRRVPRRRPRLGLSLRPLRRAPVCDRWHDPRCRELPAPDRAPRRLRLRLVCADPASERRRHGPVLVAEQRRRDELTAGESARRRGGDARHLHELGQRPLDRRLLHADDRRPVVRAAERPAQRIGRPQRAGGRRRAHLAPAARGDPLRFVPRLQPGQDAARAARPARAARGGRARPHRPQLLPPADLVAVPQRACLRVRLRDRRLPGRCLCLVAARRQIRPRRGNLAGGSADRARAGRARRAGDSAPSRASSRGGRRMTTQAPERSYRIGDVAERVGVTTRTIRYYEELGLLRTASARTKGAHRLYTDADIARLEELIRLRDLLGLTLEELVALAEAEEARAALRNQWAESATDIERARIVKAAIPLVERQLE